MNPLKVGQRLEKIKYYCDVRKSYFTRNVVIDDELEIRRQLHGTVFMTSTAKESPHVKHLLVKSIQGEQVSAHNAKHSSKSVPGLLFGKEYARMRRVNPDQLWNLTREAYGIKKSDVACSAPVIEEAALMT